MNVTHCEGTISFDELVYIQESDSAGKFDVDFDGGCKFLFIEQSRDLKRVRKGLVVPVSRGRGKGSNVWGIDAKEVFQPIPWRGVGGPGRGLE